MAFGAELRDFVSAFQAGYNMFQSADEKDWEKEKRQMERDRFSMSKEDRQYQRERDTKSDEYREEERDYQHSRDSKSDDRWEQEFERLNKNDQWNKERTARKDVQEDEDAAIKRDEIKQKKKARDAELRRKNLVPDQVDRFISGDREEGGNPLWTPPEDNAEEQPPVVPDEQSAIPDDAEATFQPASYSANDNTGFNLRNYLRSIRSSESGGNDRAKNPKSTATGRYQFLASTWRGLANKYPDLGLTDRYDGDQQETAIRQFTYDNAKVLSKAGIPITNGNLYAAHFLGSDGARKVLRADPDAAVSEIVPRAVVRANPFLADMTVSDFERWVSKKGNRYSSSEGTVQMASGGLVQAIPDDPMAQQSMAEQELVDHQLSLPDEEPEQQAIPAPEYEGTETSKGVTEIPEDDEHDDPSYDDMYKTAQKAVRDGMNKASEELGLDQDAAVDDDPELEKAYENYANGYGAAPDEVMRQVLDSVDPERKRPPAERNMLAMGTVYRFYMENGQPDKAQEAAKSMVQYYRSISTRFMSLAQAAASEGELDDAAKAAVAAYANIPNGRDLDINKTEKGYQVTVTDSKTGKKISQDVFDPREFAAIAMRFDPSTFDDEIYNAAGEKRPEYSDASLEDIDKISTDAPTKADELWGDMPAERKAPLMDTATRIASLKENQMGLDQAMRFVDPSDKTPLDIKPVRQRPDMVEVTKDGVSVIMPKGYAKKLLGVRKSIADETIKQANEDKQSSAEWQDVYKKGEDAAGAIVDRAAEDLNTPSMTEKATKKVIDTFTSPRTMDDVEKETAIPDQEGPRKTFAELLVEREDLAAAEQTPETAARLAEVNRLLKEMGLNE